MTSSISVSSPFPSLLMCNTGECESENDKTMTLSSRRRSSSSPSREDSTLLFYTEINDVSVSYATFHGVKRQREKTCMNRIHPLKQAELFSKVYDRLSAFFESPISHFRDHKAHVESKHCRRLLNQFSWRVILAAFACISLSLYQMRGRLHGDSAEPEWRWDHNIYNPRRHASSSESSLSTTTSVASIWNEPTFDKRNMLLAQVTGGNTILESLGDICSRPNRAYARQWGRDYVRYLKPARKLERSCFDKVAFLSAVLRSQKQILYETRNGNSDWLRPQGVVYDVVALFPPDAIITDLDEDLLNLLPDDKLLAIAGWNEDDSSIKESNLADVLLLNLRHEFAGTVVDLWHTMVQPPITCGAGNDLSILLDVIESVLGMENLTSVVVPLSENRKGMIEGNAIKVIPLKVPGSKASMLLNAYTESKIILQTTADSVCYRYYPKCEVF